MEELLETLEKKIRVLVDKHYQAKHEKDQLLIRQHHAVKQIEDLISRLKTIEEG